MKFEFVPSAQCGGGLKKVKLYKARYLVEVTVARNLKAVLAGSNITDFATGNSSGGLAEREKASGKFKFHKAFHGESFFSPGWAEPAFRDWYSQMRKNDLLTAAKSGGIAGGGTAQKITRATPRSTSISMASPRAPRPTSPMVACSPNTTYRVAIRWKRASRSERRETAR